MVVFLSVVFDAFFINLGYESKDFFFVSSF